MAAHDPVERVLSIRGMRNYETVQDQSKYICNLFFQRTPEDRITSKSLTAIRDMIDYDADLVEKELTRRLNMEFDWKRRPDAIGTCSQYHDHVIFSTVPWQSVEHFQSVREQFAEYQKKNPICIKSPDDYEKFAVYVESVLSLSEDNRKYLSSDEPDLVRLRQTLCKAWHQQALGLVKGMFLTREANGYIQTAEEFAQLLTDCGIPTARHDVENARKTKTHSLENFCPRTERCVDAVAKLKRLYPQLDFARSFSKYTVPDLLHTRPASDSVFVSKAGKPESVS